jgi:hypothetical protein
MEAWGCWIEASLLGIFFLRQKEELPNFPKRNLNYAIWLHTLVALMAQWQYLKGPA